MGRIPPTPPTPPVPRPRRRRPEPIAGHGATISINGGEPIPVSSFTVDPGVRYVDTTRRCDDVPSFMPIERTYPTVEFTPLFPRVEMHPKKVEGCVYGWNGEEWIPPFAMTESDVAKLKDAMEKMPPPNGPIQVLPEGMQYSPIASLQDRIAANNARAFSPPDWLVDLAFLAPFVAVLIWRTLAGG